MSRINWHLGCSGFLYREWKPDFYPPKLPQRKWLEYYSSQYNSLELNASFYKFPEARNLQKFYDETGEGFSVSLKVPRLITHYKQLKACEQLMADFYGAVRLGLKSKAGCVLFQFPPKFSYSAERLDLLSQLVNTEFKNVAEFRNETWFDTHVTQQLSRHNIVISGLSHPALREHQEAVCASPLAYYRFHGIPQLFYSEYKQPEIEKVVNAIIACDDVSEAYIYFNNTASMAALANLNTTKEMLQAYLDR